MISTNKIALLATMQGLLPTKQAWHTSKAKQQAIIAQVLAIPCLIRSKYILGTN